MNFGDIEKVVEWAHDPAVFLEDCVVLKTVDGNIPFGVTSYQKRMFEAIANTQFTVCKWSRQAGKTSAVIGYCLWYLIFHNDTNVALISCNRQRAKNVICCMNRMYESLPEEVMPQRCTLSDVPGAHATMFENGSVFYSITTHEFETFFGTHEGINLLIIDDFDDFSEDDVNAVINRILPRVTQNEKVVAVSTPRGLKGALQSLVEALGDRNVALITGKRDVLFDDEDGIMRRADKHADFYQSHMMGNPLRHMQEFCCIDGNTPISCKFLFDGQEIATSLYQFYRWLQDLNGDRPSKGE